MEAEGRRFYVQYLTVSMLSFPAKGDAGSMFQNIYCLSEGYSRTTFVCSPLVAQRKDSETYRIIPTEFTLWKFLRLMITSFPAKKHYLFLIYKFSFAGKTADYTGYHCFILFKWGLPMGYLLCSWKNYLVFVRKILHLSDLEIYFCWQNCGLHVLPLFSVVYLWVPDGLLLSVAHR